MTSHSVLYVTRICAALRTVFLDRFWFYIVNIKIMESMSPMIVIVMASNDNLLVSWLNNNDVLIIIQDLHIDHDIDIDFCDRQWLRA